MPMIDVQWVRIDEVLLEYQRQEQQALKELHATQQWNRVAEVALQLECAKLRDAELLAQQSKNQVAAHRQSVVNSPGLHTSSSSYLPPSQ